MDSFYFNKVAGAVLASLLVLVGANTAIHLFYPKGTANLSKGRIVVAPEAAAPATPAAAKSEEKEPPVESLLASANVEAGQNAAKACGAAPQAASTQAVISFFFMVVSGIGSGVVGRVRRGVLRVAR